MDCVAFQRGEKVEFMINCQNNNRGGAKKV